MKKCSTCKENLPEDMFNKDSSKPSGLQSNCRSCNKYRLRQWRNSNMDKVKDYRNSDKNDTATYQRTYSRTKLGRLKRTHRGMVSRCTGKATQYSLNAGKGERYTTYIGLKVCSLQEFIDWSLQNPEFHKLFNRWEESGYQYDQVLSIDRIDNSGGYTLDNMQWILLTENREKGSK